MLVSVVIKTRNEAQRLRLVLASLVGQSVPIIAPGSRPPDSEIAAEIVVVDDASTDLTPAVLESEAKRLPFRVLRLSSNKGRSAASNAGAAAACGEVLLFLDGDTLAAPDLIERHARAHASGRIQARGETNNLRCTRFFLDPETGSPWPGQEDHVRKMGAELTRHFVTRRQVTEQFDEITRRAQPGIYPGAGPRRLFEVEWDALSSQPDLEVLWMAAAGHNASVPRLDFERAGGFDERLSINEHRELALRLQRAGVPIRPVPGASSYHLTHRVGWRDPLTDKDWERIFYEVHPCPAVKLMSVFWLSLSDDPEIPEEGRIVSLPAMDAAAKGKTSFDFEALRRVHPRLGPLGQAS